MSFQRNINLLGSPCNVAIKSVAGNQILPDFTKIYGKPSKIRVSSSPKISKAGILITKKVTLEYPGVSDTDFTKFHELMHDGFEMLVTYSSGEVFQFAGVNAPMTLSAPYNNKGTKLSFITKDVKPVQFLSGTITTQGNNSTLTIISILNTPQLTTINLLDNIKGAGVYFFDTTVQTTSTVTYSTFPSVTQVPITNLSIDFSLSGATLEVYGVHNDTTDNFLHVTQKFTSGLTGKVFYRQYNSNEDGWYAWYSIETTLRYISVTASRNFLNSDKGKVLILQNSGIILTMPITGMDADFNCCTKALTGYDGTMDFLTNTKDAPNGLLIEENKMMSIGRLGSTYIISP
ncbi:MAG: hypothetical protein HRT69_10915 [Flavobacteriaceae bacterium]|nr:hypothetical protein [Flavobacteriaceae bacterium]